MANTQIVLLEHVDTLGRLGDVVSVKPGYARNFLLPQGKALRATKDNMKFFEVQRAALEAANKDKTAQAEKDAKKLDGAKVVLIRQASEGGQLYGSVAARDIAEAVTEATQENVGRSQIVLNTNIKTLGLFDVTIALYGDIKATVNVNVARTEDEAAIQEKTGEALTSQTAAADEKEAKSEQAVEATDEAIEGDAAEAEIAAEENAA